MIVKKEYITSKQGEKPESCQDAYEYNHNLSRYAVADGATREFFSAKLARELVRRFCFDEDEININILKSGEYEKWLEPIQENWLTYIEDIIENKKVNSFVKNRFNKKESAASTFVGLEVDRENFTFKTMIIGDSCFFHIRDDEILESIPIDNHLDFDNSPEFFFSRDFILNSKYMIEQREFTPANVEKAKSFQEGDYFLLASDAISEWLLLQKYNGEWSSIWNRLLNEDESLYDKLIKESREDKDNKLKDDDVTILILSTNNSEDNKKIENQDLDESKKDNLESIEEEIRSEDSNSCLEEDTEDNIVADSIHENIIETKEEFQKIFLLLYKTNTVPLKVFNPYFKETSQDKGFKFIRQKKEQEINKKYKEGILLIDYTHFDNKYSGVKQADYVIYYKFSNKALEGYKYSESYKSYIKEIEKITYDHILRKNKIDIILGKY